MFAHDRGWRRRLDEALLTGLTAEAAVQRVRNDTRARMLRQIDPYARERLHDIDDLSNRLLRLLSGGAVTAAAGNLPQDTILIARTMGPAELLDYDRQRLRGLVLEEGGSTSHVAIVARALGIAAHQPGQGRARRGRGGRRGHRRRRRRRSAYAADAGGGVGLCRQGPLPGAAPGPICGACAACRRSPSTASGSSLNINAGLAVRSAASRSVRRRRHRPVPHRAAIHDLGDLPAARAADPHLQGDPRCRRRPARWCSARSMSAATRCCPISARARRRTRRIGWRAIRMALDRPALFRTQIRALLRAAHGRELRVMLPMIADVSELSRGARADRPRGHRSSSAMGGPSRRS